MRPEPLARLNLLCYAFGIVPIEEATNQYIEAARDFEQKLIAVLFGGSRSVEFHVLERVHFLKVCYVCKGWSSGTYAHVSRKNGQIREFVYASSLEWKRVFGNVLTGEFGLPTDLPEPNTDLSAVWTAWFCEFTRVPFALSEDFNQMLKKAALESVIEAVRIAAAKRPAIASDEDRVKYIFGILRQQHLKQLAPERAADEETFFKLRQYWRNLPRGTGYLDKALVHDWLKHCSPDEIRVIMHSTQGLWADLRDEMQKVIAHKTANAATQA